MNDPTLSALNSAAGSASRARRRIALSVGAVSVLAVLATSAWAFGQASVPARALSSSRGTGWVAFGALALSLLVTPLSRVAARTTTSAARYALLRRALGMSAAWLALGHALLSLSGTLDWNWTALWSWPHLRAGLTALFILLVLLATSFTAVIAALRLRFWRELHRLVYLVPLLVAQHALLSPFASRTWVLLLLSGLGVLGLARLLPAPPPAATPDANRDWPV